MNLIIKFVQMYFHLYRVHQIRNIAVEKMGIQLFNQVKNYTI